MSFMQFAVWGAYLTCMGIYLSRIGMGHHIGSFFAMQGFVSFFMPTVIGIIADRWIPAQRLYGCCHLVAGVSMVLAGLYGQQAGMHVSFPVLFSLYSLSIAFYMPSLSLSYSVAYNALTMEGQDIVKSFPPIRVFGTVGFIAMMWLVDVMDYEQNHNQFIVSGVLGILLFLYSFTLPSCPVNRRQGNRSYAERFGLQAFVLFKRRDMAVFLVFSVFIGICLQITNGFATPYINHFQSVPAYADSFGVKYPVILYSISQFSETFSILLIPFFMKRFGIKKVVVIAAVAWFLRFGLLGMGNPGSGAWMFVLSMVIYGVAFDFFNISGSLFINQTTDTKMRSSAQGMFLLMTNGFGATIGSLAAQAVVNAHTAADGSVQWAECWYVFAVYALIVGVAFHFLFHPEKKEALL